MLARLAYALGFAVLGGLALVGNPPDASAQDVQGAGSTFVAPVLARWIEDYDRQTGAKIVYDSVGSGAGIERIEAGTVDFGATDKPLSPAELAKYGLCQFPIVIGAVVPVVNLRGVAPGQMKFTGQVLADIYQGKITRWNDPEIAALNDGMSLPAMPIVVVHRSDGSGTTYNWVAFLAQSSPAWKSKIGVGLSVNWPVGTGGNGNDGVAAAVSKAPGAIGYVEYSIALKNGLTFGQVRNAHEIFVIPNPETFQAAASTVDWKQYPDFSSTMTNASDALAYPVTAASFIVMYKAPKYPARTMAALKFFKWVLERGDVQANQLRYVPLPPELVLLIENYWKSHIASNMGPR